MSLKNSMNKAAFLLLYKDGKLSGYESYIRQTKVKPPMNRETYESSFLNVQSLGEFWVNQEIACLLEGLDLSEEQLIK